MNKQLQIELWEECNNHCTFCYIGKQNRYTPDKIKLNSLKNAYNLISDLNTYKEYDIVAYIGGEFFQGQLNTPKIKEEFFKLMTKTSELLKQGYIKEVWIYMTLTIGDQKDLYDTIKLFDGVTDKLWLLTSYDTVGRFHSLKMEENWKYHMKNIHKLYPEIKLNTTTILSSNCIKKYLNDEISFRKMREEFHTEFFFKQVGCVDTKPSEYNQKYNIDFVPTRKLFLDFLRKFKVQEEQHVWDRLFNIEYRADLLIRNGNDLKHQMIKHKRYKDHRSAEIEIDYDSLETKIAPCGHIYTYHVYSDCDGCVLCDKEMLADG